MNNIAHSLARLATALLVGLAVAACSTPKPPKAPDTPAETMPQEMAGAPEWVTERCEKYWDDDSETHLCSVGAVSGTMNPGLARSAAVARARTEMARGLESKVQALLMDYQATATGGSAFAKLASDEQYIVDVSKQITDTSLSGTKFESSWVSQSGTYYVLISLDLKTFENAIGRDQSLPESTRTAIVERAEAAFADLDAEIEKQRVPMPTTAAPSPEPPEQAPSADDRLTVAATIQLCKEVQAEAVLPIACSVTYLNGRPSMFVTFADQETAGEYWDAMSEAVADPFCEAANAGNRQAFVYISLADTETGRIYGCESDEWTDWFSYAEESL